MIHEAFKGQPCKYNNKLGIYHFSGMDKFGPGTIFNKKVNEFFNLPLIVNRNKIIEQGGNGKSFTSVGLNPILPFVKTIGLENTELYEWIKNTLHVAANEMGVPHNKEKNRLIFKKQWGNRIYKGSSGKAHSHDGCHITCIFYYEVPKKSSKLVLINEKIQDILYIPVEDLNPRKTETITPTPGMLVCHDPLLPHAVSTHGSKLPRTCFVFDVIIEGIPLPVIQQTLTKTR